MLQIISVWADVQNNTGSCQAVDHSFTRQQLITQCRATRVLLSVGAAKSCKD